MAIEIRDLTVQFHNGTRAVNGVNIAMKEGIYGLLGENGAGKTTLMRVLTTIIKPTYGQVILNGQELKEKNYSKIQKMIGYLPQELGLYPNLTVRESLEYMGGLAGLSKSEYKNQITYYLDKTSLIQHQNKKNRQLSGGMKRRVGLVQAMLHNPEILIVDEPTTGLDPEERIRIRNLLVEFSKGRIVLFSTHVVEDLTATCNTLGVLRKGTLLYDGKISTLIEKARGHVWIGQLENEEEYGQIQKRYRISSKQYTENGLEVRIIANEKPELSICKPVGATLEDAYMDLMGEKYV